MPEIPAADTQMEHMDEFLEHPEIQAITELLRKNAVLAELIGPQHTTQRFATSENLSLAFKMELEQIDPKLVAEDVAHAVALAIVMDELREEEKRKNEDREMPDSVLHDIISANPAIYQNKIDEIAERYPENKEEYQYIFQKLGIEEEQLTDLFSRVWVYSRLTNPTNELLEEVVSEMEHTEKSASFASGLGAINAVIRQFVKPAKNRHLKKIADKVVPKGVRKVLSKFLPKKVTDTAADIFTGGKLVIVGSIYGGTTASIKEICEREGIEFYHMPISKFEEEGLPDDTDMVYFETSNNPTLRIVPMQKLVEEAKRVGAVSVCDNTFTPLTVKPADHGVDLVLHSMTKYMNGESEDLGGIVSGNTESICKLLDLHHGQRMTGGANMAPRVAKDFLIKMASLPERLYRATQNARAVAKIAKKFNAGENRLKVRTADSYIRFNGGISSKTREDIPGIKDPEMPETISNGMVSIFLPTIEQAHALANKMIQRNLGKGAVSLGATTTYFSIPSVTTHSEMDEEEQARVGITPGLIRISCGSEKNLPEEIEEILTELLGEPGQTDAP